MVLPARFGSLGARHPTRQVRPGGAPSFLPLLLAQQCFDIGEARANVRVHGLDCLVVLLDL